MLRAMKRLVSVPAISYVFSYSRESWGFSRHFFITLLHLNIIPWSFLVCLCFPYTQLIPLVCWWEGKWIPGGRNCRAFLCFLSWISPRPPSSFSTVTFRAKILRRPRKMHYHTNTAKNVKIQRIYLDLQILTRRVHVDGVTDFF